MRTDSATPLTQPVIKEIPVQRNTPRPTRHRGRCCSHGAPPLHPRGLTPSGQSAKKKGGSNANLLQEAGAAPPGESPAELAEKVRRLQEQLDAERAERNYYQLDRVCGPRGGVRELTLVSLGQDPSVLGDYEAGAGGHEGRPTQQGPRGRGGRGAAPGGDQGAADALPTRAHPLCVCRCTSRR